MADNTLTDPRHTTVPACEQALLDADDTPYYCDVCPEPPTPRGAGRPDGGLITMALNTYMDGAEKLPWSVWRCPACGTERGGHFIGHRTDGSHLDEPSAALRCTGRPERVA